MVAAIVGSFLGILVGGLLSQLGWRWVFLANVPFGIFGTIWAFLQLKEIGVHIRARIDWLGNIAFAGGLGMLLVGVTYGIEPYGHSLTGWGNPFVLGMIFGGLALLAAFARHRAEGKDPMFSLAALPHPLVHRRQHRRLPRRRWPGWLPVHPDHLAPGDLAAPARLRLHRHAALGRVYMIPWTAGFVLSGPLSGRLSDRYGARPFATVGMADLGRCLPSSCWPSPPTSTTCSSPWCCCSAASPRGLFASPNTSSIMNSVPARDRGAASGMRVTFANTGMPLSMGLLFTLMVLGLNGSVPAAMYTGLVTHGVPAATATQLAHVPPLGYLFAAFLGYNPIAMLLGPKVLAGLTAHQAAALTSRQFFPQLIGPAFKDALVPILVFGAVMSLVAALASALRGSRFVHEEAGSTLQRVARARAHAARAAAESVPEDGDGVVPDGDGRCCGTGDVAAVGGPGLVPWRPGAPRRHATSVPPATGPRPGRAAGRAGAGRGGRGGAGGVEVQADRGGWRRRRGLLSVWGRGGGVAPGGQRRAGRLSEACSGSAAAARHHLRAGPLQDAADLPPGHPGSETLEDLHHRQGGQTSAGPRHLGLQRRAVAVGRVAAAATGTGTGVSGTAGRAAGGCSADGAGMRIAAGVGGASPRRRATRVGRSSRT